MVLSLLRIFVGHVETHMVEGVNLHLVVNSSCDDIAGGKAETLVIFLHKLLTVWQTQNAAVAAHCLCYEVCGVGLLWIIEHGGVELHKLHVLHLSFCPIDHRDSVACGNVGV